MNGLLLYREYLNNVSSCLINYDIPKIEIKELSDILDIAKDIEDISYLDKILSLAGNNGLFDKDKEFIKKLVRLESKLKKFMDVSSIENIMSLDSLYDIEDSIINCVGDLADLSNDLNYTNLSISNLNMGFDENDIGVNKLKTYQEEISKVFGFLDDCAKKPIKSEDLLNSVIKITDKETSLSNVTQEEDIILYGVPEIDENLEIEGINEEEIDDIDEWVSNQDNEIIEKYKNREIEEDYLDEDYEDDYLDNSLKEFDTLKDEQVDTFKNSIHTPDKFDVVESFEEEIENASIKKPDVSEEKLYKRKEKLVVHESVTEVDDILAKMILAFNDNISKIPKVTVNLAEKVKGEGKKIYSNMKVEDDEEDN